MRVITPRHTAQVLFTDNPHAYTRVYAIRTTLSRD
jgi:hypothetical protein